MALCVPQIKIKSMLSYVFQVIHYLQEERDMSALYLSDLGRSRSKSLLLQRYPETDRALEKLPFWTSGKTAIIIDFSESSVFSNGGFRMRYRPNTKLLQ